MGKLDIDMVSVCKIWKGCSPNQGVKENEIDYANGENDDSTLNGRLESTNDGEVGNNWLPKVDD